RTLGSPSASGARWSPPTTSRPSLWPSLRSPTSLSGSRNGSGSTALPFRSGRRADATASREGPMRFRLVVNGEGHEVETDGGVTVDGRRLEGKTVEDAGGITVHIGKKRY